MNNNKLNKPWEFKEYRPMALTNQKNYDHNQAKEEQEHRELKEPVKKVNSWYGKLRM